jgi:hypothetical protein
MAGEALAYVQGASLKVNATVLLRFTNSPVASNHAGGHTAGESMPIFHQIVPLEKKLSSIERGLKSIKDNDKLPTPADMQALAYIRTALPLLIAQCRDLEPELWQRVEVYRTTPYTLTAHIFRTAFALLGYWLLGTLALYGGFLWAIESFFPSRWHVIAVSAGIAFIAIIYIMIFERRRRS